MNFLDTIDSEMVRITCHIEDLDMVRERFRMFSHFTVGGGRAKYHLVHLANSSDGVYYALRCGEDNTDIIAKRQLEPLSRITCWGLM